MNKVYDIFISYRKKVSGDKPELLWQILESSGFKGHVSFDKDNLTGRFNSELLKRVDYCKDFIVLIFPETFCNCSSNKTACEFYKNLTKLPIDSFIAEVKRLGSLSQCDLAKEIGWEGDPLDAHIDYMRIEVDRALIRAEKEKINIIPITILSTDHYSFSQLQLPDDLKAIKDFQAIFYSESSEERFNRVLPDLFKRLHSKPKSTGIKVLSVLLFAIIICIGGFYFVNYSRYIQEVNIRFNECVTQSDYENFIQVYPKSDKARQCKDSVALMKSLKNNGCAYVNNAGVGTVDAAVKENNTIKDIIWSPNISLNQLRAVIDILNRMMEIEVRDSTFIMGQEDDISYDAPPHHVKLTENFHMCQYEITRKWWYAIMKDSLVTTKRNYPISDVTWDDAISFTEKLMELTRLKFSLPTEAQWEWAATSGLNYTYSGSSDANSVAWYASNSDGRLHEVGQLSPNPHQLYDMSGNVAEWCMDYMSKYKNSTVIDPVVLKKDKTNGKIVRGGSMLTNKRDLNVRHRAVQSEYESNMNIGFRIVLIND